MAFIPGNLALAVDTISGGSLRIHGYRPSPVDDNVYASGYFTGAALYGIRLGDLIVIITPSGSTGATVTDMVGNDATITAEAGASGAGFDVAITPTVTAGVYSGGDIMGGLMTFPVSSDAGRPIILSGIQVTVKSAVTPTLTLVLFKSDPTATTKTDNAAYSLNAADAFKVLRAFPLIAMGAAWVDHGTPNTIQLDGLAAVLSPPDDGVNIFGLLIDATGVTLGSTSDVQVRLSGASA